MARDTPAALPGAEQLSGLDEIVPLLHELGVDSVLLVTDRGLREGGLTLPLERLLEQEGVTLAVYDQTRVNPTTQDAQRAKELYLANRCGAIVAFGGGSPMDCAKAAGAMIVYPKKTAWQMRGLLRVRRRLPPLIAVPTTAGTGSEATLAAVITDPEKHRKCTMNSFALIPHYAVLDPSLTCSLPPTSRPPPAWTP